MAADTAFPFDVKFTIAGDSTVYGYMLTSPKDQSKQISFAEAGGPEVQRISSQDVASYSDFNPKVDTPFVMTSWVGGAGQLDFDFGNQTQYLWADGVITHVDGKAYLAPPVNTLALTGSTGDITGIISYIKPSTGARYDFLWEGVNLWRRDASNSTNAWGIVYTAPSAITDFKVCDGVGLIAIAGYSHATIDYYYQSDVSAAATWTPTSVNGTPFSDAAGKPKFFQVIRGTTYAIVDNDKVYYNVNPTLDTWLGPIDTSVGGNIGGTPGDATYPYQEPRAVGDYMFVPKYDAVYSIDSQQDVLEVIWQWKDRPNSTNFKYHTACGDQFVYAVGTEVFVYDPTTGMNIPTFVGRQSSFSIREIRGLGADNRFIYLLAKVSVPILQTDSSTWGLIRMYRSSATSWAFEILWSVSDNTADYSNLQVCPTSTGARVYWGKNRNSGDTQTCLMDFTDEWDESAGANFRTTPATLYMSVSKSGFPAFVKRHLYFNMFGVADANNKIGLIYSLDEAASYTSDSVFLTGTNSTTSFDNKQSTSIIIALSFYSQNGTVTPVLRAFDHHQRVRYRYLPTAILSIRLARDMELRDHSHLSKEVATLWQELVTLRTTNSKITYTDFLGNSFIVTVDSLAEIPVINEGVNEYELEAQLTITQADRGS